MTRIASIALAAFAALPMIAAHAGSFGSVYTKHSYQDCMEDPSSEPDVSEVRRCEGPDGHPVLWTGAPDASWVEFGSGPFAIPDLDTFFEVAPVLEWRGPLRKGKVVPQAVIARYHTGPAIGRLSSSRLVVHRLDGRPCVIAVIHGVAPKANEKARAAADAAHGASCL